MIMYVLIVLIFGLMSIIILNKLINENNLKIGAIVMRFIGSEFKHVQFNEQYKKKHPLLRRKRFFIEQYIGFSQINQIKEIDDKTHEYFSRTGLDRKYIKNLSSRRKYKRIHAAYTLAYVRTPNTLRALELVLESEKSNLVKLYLIEALSHYSSPTSISYIIRALFYSTDWLKSKVNVLLTSYDKYLFDCLKLNINNERDEVEELIIHFAQHYPSSLLKDYLLKHALRTEYLDCLAIDKVDVPDYFDLDDEFKFTQASKELNSAAHLRLKTVFSSENYLELLRFVGIDARTTFSEDLRTYKPKKNEFFIYWQFRILTANSHPLLEYLNYFAGDFLPGPVSAWCQR